MDDDRKAMGGRLTLARIRAGYASPKEFYSRHDIPQGTYSLHESGNRGLTVKAAKKYAGLLKNVTAEWLLYGDGDSPQPLEGRGASLAQLIEAQAVNSEMEAEASFMLLYDRLMTLAQESEDADPSGINMILRSYGYEIGDRGTVQLSFRFWRQIERENDNLTLTERVLKQVAILQDALESAKEVFRKLGGRPTTG